MSAIISSNNKIPVEDFDPKILASTGTTTIPRPPSPVFAIPTPIAHKRTMANSKEVRFKL